MTFQQNIARLVIGDHSLNSIQDIALQALEDGLDTPSLRILAGLPDNEYSFTVDKYLNDTLVELSCPWPDKRDAAIEVAAAIANEVIEGKRKIFEGTQDLIQAIRSYPFEEETKAYVYDSIGFEKAYGLFYTIDDLRCADYPWKADKSNKEIEQEVIAELLQELISWTTRMKNGS